MLARSMRRREQHDIVDNYDIKWRVDDVKHDHNHIRDRGLLLRRRRQQGLRCCATRFL